MAKLAGLIAPMDSERFYLLKPTNVTTASDRRKRQARYRGYSPEMKQHVIAILDLTPRE